MKFIDFFKEYWKKIVIISILLTLGSILLMSFGLGHFSIFGVLIIDYNFGIGFIIEFLCIFFIFGFSYYLSKIYKFGKYIFIFFILLLFVILGFDYDLMTLMPQDRDCNIDFDCYANLYETFFSPQCNTICVNKDWERYKPIISRVFATLECLPEDLKECKCINKKCTKVDITCGEYCNKRKSQFSSINYSQCLEVCLEG